MVPNIKEMTVRQKIKEYENMGLNTQDLKKNLDGLLLKKKATNE